MTCKTHERTSERSIERETKRKKGEFIYIHTCRIYLMENLSTKKKRNYEYTYMFGISTSDHIQIN